MSYKNSYESETVRIKVLYNENHQVDKVKMGMNSGYTQIKRILDEHHPNKGYNKEFLAKREELRAKIEEGVYRYGMLVK